MKFIGSGGARMAYILDNGHCLKTAIPERKTQGDTQNAQEAKVLTSGDYCCFPKFYKIDESGLEVEDCRFPAYKKYDFLDDYFDGIDLNALNSVRQDPYTNIPLNNDSLRVFAFVIGYVTDVCIRSHVDTTSFTAFVTNILNSLHEYNLVDLPVSAFKTFLTNLNNDNSERGHAMRDLFEYYFRFGYEDGFMIADLWNPTQWGIKFLENGEYRPIVIDAGFTSKISNRLYPQHHIVPLANVVMTKPGEDSTKFNGIELSEIKSPKGGKTNCKFWTKSEYILTDDGMSRHIKNLGLKDDGMWDWSDKMTFMPYDDLKRVMQAISRVSPKAVKIEFNDNSLSVQAIDETGEWKESLNVDSVKYMPAVGMHVCEFTLDGYNGKSGILRRYHPGHDVTYIENQNK